MSVLRYNPGPLARTPCNCKSMSLNPRISSCSCGLNPDLIVDPPATRFAAPPAGRADNEAGQPPRAGVQHPGPGTAATATPPASAGRAACARLAPCGSAPLFLLRRQISEMLQTLLQRLLPFLWQTLEIFVLLELSRSPRRWGGCRIFTQPVSTMRSGSAADLRRPLNGRRSRGLRRPKLSAKGAGFSSACATTAAHSRQETTMTEMVRELSKS